MGIYGLTSYMRENKRTLSKTVELPGTSRAGTSTSTLVVDGWSFIYELQHHSSLGYDWVYGGEYEHFTQLVDASIRMWLAVGLIVHFVFDGPYPELKFPTLVSRASQSYIQPSQMFFRTSPASRTSPRSLRENHIIPPLMYAACLRRLHLLHEKLPHQVYIHHADEEGDPFAVSLAGQLGAYVTGRDSDYIILNAEGYRGYVPLDEMVWAWSIPPAENVDIAAPMDDDFGFQPVRKGKRRPLPIVTNANQRSGLGLLPTELPFEYSSASFPIPPDLSVSFTVYTPASLALNLQLPVPLLPLVGSLVGNDYTQMSGEVTVRSRHQHLFFERSLSPSQRITHVAATLRAIRTAAASPSPRRGVKPITSVIDLIEAAVTRLIMRDVSSMGSGELEEIVNTVAEAALQYALPPVEPISSDICGIHLVADCPLIHTLSRGFLNSTNDDAVRAEVRNQYIMAYRTGRLSPRILDVLATGTMWPKLFLESPDQESTARSVGAPLRAWAYALLDDALGVRGAGASEYDTAIGSTDGGDSDDELIDVVEVQTPSDEEGGWDPQSTSTPALGDPLSALKSKLEQLKAAGIVQSATATPDGSAGPPSVAPMSPLPISQLSTRTAPSARSIVEHVRRGTRLAEEPVPIRSLAYLEQNSGWSWSEATESTADVPLLLRNEDDRLHVFLRIMGSDTAQLRALPSEQLAAAIAVRYLVRRFHERAVENGHRKESEQERWTRRDARAFLSGFAWCGSRLDRVVDSTDDFTVEAAAATIPVENRAVQLVAQSCAALEALEILSHVLLLATRVPNPAHRLSGRRIHMALGRLHEPDIPASLWSACQEGLEGMFAEERGKHGRQERKKAAAAAAPQSQGLARMNSRQTKAGGNLFHLLGSMST